MITSKQQTRDTEKPTPIKYEFERIPESMKQESNWLLWRYEQKNGRWTKVPYQPDGKKAKSTDPKTWRTFDEAEIAYMFGGFDGIGFAIGDSNLTCVDVDHISEWDFKTPLAAIDSHCYAELSPSGDGLHLWLKAKKPNEKCKSKNFHSSMVEVYNSDRFITMTGANGEGEITDCQAQFDEAFKGLFFPEGNKLVDRNTSNNDLIKMLLTKSDEEIISRISNENSSSRAEWIKWHNCGLADSEDASSSDMGYLNKIAFYTKDAEQIERIWLSSAIGKREKTQQRKDYRERTIDKVINDVADYTPNNINDNHTAQMQAEEPDEFYLMKARQMLSAIDEDNFLKTQFDEPEKLFQCKREHLVAFGNEFDCQTTAKAVYDAIPQVEEISAVNIDFSIKVPEHVDITKYVDIEKNPLLDAPSFADLLATPVDAKEFLFHDELIPDNEVTILTGANGAGKTQLSVQIAINAVLNKSMMFSIENGTFFAPTRKMRVLIASFEDDTSIYAHRVQKTVKHYPDFKYNHMEALREIGLGLSVINVPDLCHTSAGLTMYDNKTRKVVADSAYYHLKQYIKKGGYDLVIIDPWHYTTTAEENDNGAMGQHTLAIRQLAHDCECAILGFSHTTDGNPVRVRGATSTMDRARQGLSMARLDRMIQHNNITKHLPKPTVEQLPHGVSSDKAIWFKKTKNSYGKQSERFYMLELDDNGMLVPFDVKGREQVMSDEERIIDKIVNAGEIYRTDLIDSMGMAKSTLDRKLEKLVDNGDIKLIQTKPKKYSS